MEAVATNLTSYIDQHFLNQPIDVSRLFNVAVNQTVSNIVELVSNVLLDFLNLNEEIDDVKSCF